MRYLSESCYMLCTLRFCALSVRKQKKLPVSGQNSEFLGKHIQQHTLPLAILFRVLQHSIICVLQNVRDIYSPSSPSGATRQWRDFALTQGHQRKALCQQFGAGETGFLYSHTGHNGKRIRVLSVLKQTHTLQS